MMLIIMLPMMQRGRINTVTDFPVLVSTSPDQQEGFATFLTELGPLQPVRAVRNSDLKNASRAMTESEAKHFAAMMMLRQALGSSLIHSPCEKQERPSNSVRLKRNSVMPRDQMPQAGKIQTLQELFRHWRAWLLARKLWMFMKACALVHGQVPIPAGFFRTKYPRLSVKRV
jgi:hypothetical protein